VRGFLCLRPQTAGSEALSELIDVHELARRLDVRPSFIYDRTRRNAPDSIPHKKIGKYVRFDPVEVEKWVAEHSR
jgi:predicted DNA-binding transcriptional regulator AlpA